MKNVILSLSLLIFSSLAVGAPTNVSNGVNGGGDPELLIEVMNEARNAELPELAEKIKYSGYGIPELNFILDGIHAYSIVANNPEIFDKMVINLLKDNLITMNVFSIKNHLIDNNGHQVHTFVNPENPKVIEINWNAYKSESSLARQQISFHTYIFSADSGFTESMKLNEVYHCKK